jgi:phosphoadenosine phosphosulfate reductase
MPAAAGRCGVSAPSALRLHNGFKRKAMGVSAVRRVSEVVPANPEPLEVKAAELARRYRDCDAADVLNAAIHNEFQGAIALVSSFGAESAALLHLAAEVEPALPVIFLDTEKHFAQYRKTLCPNTQLSDQTSAPTWPS